jgi:multidrug efflux pump subunit AcrA (membrane-fusion protein)
MFQPKQKEIFSKAALERLSSPEQLDQLMQVTTPKGWLALIGLGTILVVALIWGIFGDIPTKVAGQGILLKAEGVYHVPATTAGQVLELYVGVGDQVSEGQTIARITPTGGGAGARVISPYTGQVLELRTTVGSVVNMGSPVVSLEALNEGQKKLEAVLFIMAGDGKKIRPGMPAEITPSTVKREEFGFIPSQVTYVSKFPTTQQGMMRTLGSEELVKQFGQSPVIEVRVELAEDSTTPSGYQWSSKGPNVSIEDGTPCSANIIIEQRRPISLVIPMFKKWFLSGPLFGGEQ